MCISLVKLVFFSFFHYLLLVSFICAVCTEPLPGKSIQWLGISNRQIRFLFSTNPTTPYTSHCNNYQEFHNFIVLYYCTIHCILSCYCTFYSIVLWYMYRPRYWAIFSNSAVQLFSCKYVTIKLSWVELSWFHIPVNKDYQLLPSNSAKSKRSPIASQSTLCGTVRRNARR